MKNKNIFRTVIILFSLMFINEPPELKSQFVKKGVLLKNLQIKKKGDTILVYGQRHNSSTTTNQYLIDDYDLRFIDIKKINLIERDYDFWEEIWFQNRAEDIKKNGWEYDLGLREDAREFYSQLIQNNLIYYDDFFYDYLYQLVNKIHPTKLIKNEPSSFGIVIMKANENKSIVFDNGLIVLTTGLIAQTKSEKELLKILTKCIAHVVLEHNSINLKRQIKTQNRAEFWGTVAAVVSSTAAGYNNSKNGNYYSIDDAVLIGASAYLLTHSIMANVGADYSSNQENKSIMIAKDYLKGNAEKFTLSDVNYLLKISNIISYTAWQHYHSLDFYKSFELVNQIKQNIALSAEDYLLLIKLKRLLDFSKESCNEILALIKAARKSGDHVLVELYKEEAMIYLRLDQKNKAKESLTNYKNGLIHLQNEGINVFPEINSIEQIIKRL